MWLHSNAAGNQQSGIHHSTELRYRRRNSHIHFIMQGIKDRSGGPGEHYCTHLASYSTGWLSKSTMQRENSWTNHFVSSNLVICCKNNLHIYDWHFLLPKTMWLAVCAAVLEALISSAWKQLFYQFLSLCVYILWVSESQAAHSYLFMHVKEPL